MTQSKSTMEKKYGNNFAKLFNKYSGDIYPVIEKIDDIPDILPYNPSEKLPKTGLHLGQRKLFLSEVQFLSKYPDTRYVIYAGAAPSNKTKYLADLFPEKLFILVDPNPFKIFIDNERTAYKENDDGTSNSDVISYVDKSITPKDIKANYANHQIIIINDFFTSEIAERLKSLNALFISDIRTKDEKLELPGDLDLIWNQALQYIWVRKLNPIAACLKFRTPFRDIPFTIDDANQFKSSFDEAKELGIDFVSDYFNNKFKYFPGDVYIQAWPGHSSTESRLHVYRNKHKPIEYNEAEYDGKYHFYNSIARSNLLHDNEYLNKKQCVDKCNDCTLEVKIWKDYLESRGEEPSYGNVMNHIYTLTRRSRGLCPREENQKDFYHGKIVNYKIINSNIERQYFERRRISQNKIKMYAKSPELFKAKDVVGGSDPLQLCNIGEKDRQRISEITSQKNVMKYIGTGEVWSDDKVDKFIKYNLEEQAQTDDIRENYYWGICYENKLVGVVGIHPVYYDKKNNYLTVFLDENNLKKGIGSGAIKKAIDKYWIVKKNDIYSDVLINNIPAQKTMEKLNFEKKQKHKIRRKQYFKYVMQYTEENAAALKNDIISKEIIDNNEANEVNEDDEVNDEDEVNEVNEVNEDDEVDEVVTENDYESEDGEISKDSIYYRFNMQMLSIMLLIALAIFCIVMIIYFAKNFGANTYVGKFINQKYYDIL